MEINFGKKRWHWRMVFIKSFLLNVPGHLMAALFLIETLRIFRIAVNSDFSPISSCLNLTATDALHRDVMRQQLFLALKTRQRYQKNSY
jgi:hypothetical protein